MSYPSLTNTYKVKIAETSDVVVADVIQMNSSASMACYLDNGNLIVYSLPSLRPLLTLNGYLPLADVRFLPASIINN